MKHLVLALALCLPLPAFAQDTSASEGMSEGVDLMQRGMRSLLDGLFSDMQPALQDLGAALADMRPMVEQLLQLVDDIGNYEAPVMLDNGDILIRRKPQLPEPPKEGEIDL